MPWIKKHIPSTRMYWHYPFGATSPESICSYVRNNQPELIQRDEFQEKKHLLDTKYTLFFDQEPINLARHLDTFRHVKSELNLNINYSWHMENGHSNWNEMEELAPATGVLVTSEKDSEVVDQVCKELGWQSAYYFFHGWAALDWYRGYDRAFLMPPPDKRTITRTFIAPNRIVAGQREHRLIMLYHIFKYEMTDNHISCPAVCPAENVSVEVAIKNLVNKYPDIKEVFNKQAFPIEFAGESGSPMHSCWLSLFDESAESLLYLVTETVATGRRLHLTEKTFKPICLRMPFMIVGTQGSLAYLRSYGFKTFGDLWDESYDDELNDDQRMEKIAFTLKAIDILPAHEKQRLFDLAMEICEYNYNHFYNGGFEQILWTELEDMLKGMNV